MPPALPTHDLRMASNPVSAIQSWSLGRTVVRWYCWWDHHCFQRTKTSIICFMVHSCWSWSVPLSSWILRSHLHCDFSPRSYYFQIMQTSVPPGAGLLTNVLTITPIIFWFTKHVISFQFLKHLYCRGLVLGYWLPRSTEPVSDWFLTSGDDCW